MVDPPAIVARFDDVAMVRQSVQQRGCHFGIGEHARPFGEGKVGCQQEKTDLIFDMTILIHLGCMGVPRKSHDQSRPG